MPAQLGRRKFVNLGPQAAGQGNCQYLGKLGQRVAGAAWGKSVSATNV
jgi:hypothetical protein